jgi:hypothetical protein
MSLFVAMFGYVCVAMFGYVCVAMFGQSKQGSHGHQHDRFGATTTDGTVPSPARQPESEHCTRCFACGVADI